MHVTFTMEGGIAYFPGLSQPVAIDSDELPEQEARELERLVEATRFFDRPTTSGPPARGAADYLQYTVTVQVGGRQHTVRLTDPVEDPGFQALLNYLRAKAKALRAAARARPSPERPS
jgi:hypothetical protein